jgi:hypothetical protein
VSTTHLNAARNDELVDDGNQQLEGMSSGVARVGKRLNVFPVVRTTLYICVCACEIKNIDFIT